MTAIAMRRLGTVISLLMLAACVASEPHLAGQWKSERSQFTITKEGDGYTIIISNPNGMLSGTYKGPYRDGAIRVTGPLAPICPEVKYARDTDRLLFCGEEFVRSAP